MKKRIFIVALILGACIVARLQSISYSIAERNFTQRFGANGYLLNAGSRFRSYKFDKSACKNKKKSSKKKYQKKCRRKK